MPPPLPYGGEGEEGLDRSQVFEEEGEGGGGMGSR